MKLEKNKWYWNKDGNAISCYLGPAYSKQVYCIIFRADGYYEKGTRGANTDRWHQLADDDEVKGVLKTFISNKYKIGTKFKSMASANKFYEIVSMDGKFFINGEGQLGYTVHCKTAFEDVNEIIQDFIPIYSNGEFAETRETLYNKIRLTPEIDASDFPEEVSTWCCDNDIGTHYEGGSFSIDWNNTEDKEPMVEYLLTTYGPSIKKYRYFTVDPT